MCGIVGFITTKAPNEYKMRQTWFEKALFVDTLRGKDNTGIAFIPKKHDSEKEVPVIKKAIPAPDFLDLHSVKKMLFDTDKYSALIGHNRWGTMGGTTNSTSHPFQHGDITMVHNGTLDYWTGLDRSFDVDSEAICSALSEATPKEVLEVLDGAYALVWHNNSDNTVHFARNKERPFHFAFSKDKKTILFASEAWMIDSLAPDGLEIEEIYSLTIGKHVTFDLSKDTLEDYTIEDFTIVPPSPAWYGGSHGKKQQTTTTTIGKSSLDLLGDMKYQRGDVVKFYARSLTPYKNDNKGTLHGVTSYFNEVGIENVVVPIVAYATPDIFNTKSYLLSGIVTGANTDGEGNPCLILRDVDYSMGSTKALPAPDADYRIVNAKGDDISQKEFDTLSKHGCALCSADVEAEDSEYIDWTEAGYPLCLDCTNDLEKQSKEA